MKAIDWRQLEQQTGGDAGLAREVLELFAGEAQSAREDVAAEGAAGRANLAHRLKGSARAVGAFVLADACEALEAHPDGERERQNFVRAVDATLEAVLARPRDAC